MERQEQNQNQKKKKKERSEGFYTTLKRVDLVVISDSSAFPLCGTGFLWREKQRRLGAEAVQSMAEFCWDLGLGCGVRRIGGVSTTTSAAVSIQKNKVEGRVAEWNGCSFSA